MFGTCQNVKKVIYPVALNQFVSQPRSVHSRLPWDAAGFNIAAFSPTKTMRQLTRRIADSEMLVQHVDFGMRSVKEA